MLNSKGCLLSRLSPMVFVFLGGIGLSACKFTPETPMEPVDSTVNMVVGLTLQDEIYSFHTHQMVNDYTDRLAHDLFRNLRDKNLTQSIVVASFVN